MKRELDTPADPPLKKLRSLEDHASLNDAVVHVTAAKHFTELTTKAISKAEFMESKHFTELATTEISKATAVLKKVQTNGLMS